MSKTKLMAALGAGMTIMGYMYMKNNPTMKNALKKTSKSVNFR